MFIPIPFFPSTFVSPDLSVQADNLLSRLMNLLQVCDADQVTGVPLQIPLILGRVTWAFHGIFLLSFKAAVPGTE